MGAVHRPPPAALHPDLRARHRPGQPRRVARLRPTLFRDYRLYVAAETDEDIPYLITYIGEDNVIMGSDYGHQDQSKDNGMVGVMQRREDLPARVVEKILSGNPTRYYGLS